MRVTSDLAPPLWPYGPPPPRGERGNGSLVPYGGGARP